MGRIRKNREDGVVFALPSHSLLPRYVESALNDACREASEDVPDKAAMMCLSQQFGAVNALRFRRYFK